MEIKDIQRKLRLLIPYLDLNSKTELANLLKVSASTFSPYVSTRGETPGDLPSRWVNIIARAIAKQSEGRISVTRAKALLNGAYKDFAREIFDERPRALGAILEDLPSSLDVQVHEVRMAFGMLAVPVAVPEGALYVPPQSRVRFSFHGEPGRKLLVFCRSRQGWQMIGPSGYHAGQIVAGVNAFPDPGASQRAASLDLNARPLGEDETRLFRFVFIAVPNVAIPPFRDEDADPSTPYGPADLSRVARFLAELQTKAAVGWGQAYVAVNANGAP